MIECYTCLQKLPLTSFALSTVRGSGRGKCKSCLSIQGKRRYQERMVKNKPHKYAYCDSCDGTFFRFKKSGGGYIASHDPYLECKFCNSKDIHRYDEGDITENPNKYKQGKPYHPFHKHQ